MTTTTSAAVEVRSLRRRYGSFEAVRGVSFDVRRGELFALLGTNGAGKTTTMDMVAGFGRPDAGNVRVLGRDPYSERRVLRPRLGIMLQEGGLPPDLTVSESAAMWAGTLTDPRPVVEALDLVDLRHREHVRVRQLSGGERRRLDLALAVMGRPAVLLLDEPTTGLDPENRRNAWQMVRALLADGVTVLMTTHYLNEAQELADRLAIMHRGEVVTAGSTAEVVAQHPARIIFGLPHGVDLPALPGLRDPYDGEHGPGRVTLRTDDLQDTLTELLGWARRHDIELAGLEARPASLEEAFLAVAESEEVPA
ncbi:ABC-2 type transport system ATP-binding protein [Actinoplanes lutulentus]|uniref:ABC-2 type transport system ATP-binding protein n=1 Tax=Actinoplanes lutulentus TaxID=1287878 RepID=A0A327Z836_9ACTN|nr:ABC transporter ATP-binding protein [Actinoplanes lutulentus]MBB2948458.1 ABC-2 type transport system ATP-binding protein [Actinoplanes lutulentus]RAK34509.1 ABC-2 type transport system ATP-binding protein [Actinoplanes lutulentus]